MTVLTSSSPSPPPPPGPPPLVKKTDGKMLAMQAKPASDWRPIPDNLIQIIHRQYNTPSSGGNLLRPAVPPSPAAPRSRKRSMPPIPLSPALLPDLLPFIRKVTEQTHLTVTTVIVALVYVNRLKKVLPPGYVTEYGTSHRIFMSSVLVASKFLDDDPLTTKKLVEVTGGEIWTSKDLTRMEMAFLKFLKWDLKVGWAEIFKFLREQNLKADEIFPNWKEVVVEEESRNTEITLDKLGALRLGSEEGSRNAGEGRRN